MTLHDLRDGDVFKWRNNIYKLVSLDTEDNATVLRLATKGNRLQTTGLVITCSGREENFNPYAEVVKGHLVWISE